MVAQRTCGERSLADLACHVLRQIDDPNASHLVALGQQIEEVVEELGFFAGAFERLRLSIKQMLDR